MNLELVENVYKCKGHSVIRLIAGYQQDISQNEFFKRSSLTSHAQVFGSEGSADFIIEYRHVVSFDLKSRVEKKVMSALVIGTEPGCSLFTFRKMWNKLNELAKAYGCEVIVCDTLQNTKLEKFISKKSYASWEGNHYIKV